jgi:polyferredoxin
MITLYVYLMEFIYRKRELSVAFANYTIWLLSAYSLMMAGLFLWLAYGSAIVFAISILFEMVLYFVLVVEPTFFGKGEGFVWQLHPGWAFLMLLFIFVSELFMGAVLDMQIIGGSFVSAIPASPLSGTSGMIILNALGNGFWFVAMVTGSTWFLAMMGIEMGALVAFKLRETRQKEQRVRLGLMMGCFAIAAVYFPSIYYSTMFPSLPTGTAVPVLGWSMGIGSAQLAPSVFVAVIATYAIIGGLVILFGRRVVCSTFCTAPLMYQGTTIDSMKTFNRTSPVARKYLGSAFSKVYSVTTGVVMASLVGASAISYLDAVGTLKVSIGGTDPTMFLFAFYFGVLWYVMFVTIPYTGDYNCVTMGWCYTGTITQAFSSIGFFRLRAKDKSVCRNCVSKDCGKACPVGNVDMVTHLKDAGEFRSSKCCGVGECVEACPYHNLYIYDVRHWMRQRSSKSSPPTAT